MAVASPVLYALWIDARREEICAEAIRRGETGGGEEAEQRFVGRAEELERVRNLVEGEPDKVLVVTGPSDAGKTTLMRRALAGRRGVLRFNLRQSPTLTVNDFVSYFNRVIDARFLLFRSWVVDLLPWTGGEGNFEMRDVLSHVDLQRSLSCLRGALERVAAEGGPAPVLCFDEFGSLLALARDEGGARVMDTMLAWFLDVTKSHLAHVVLCITDAQVLGNMHVFKEKSLSARSRFFCLGDFDREAADRYLAAGAPSLGAAERADALARLGGRVLDLDTLANEVRIGADAADTVDRMVSVHRERALMALTLEGCGSVSSLVVHDDSAADGARWSSTQLWAAMRALVDSPRGYVPLAELMAALDDAEREAASPVRVPQAIHSLIEADILGLRLGVTPDMAPPGDAGGARQPPPPPSQSGSYYVNADSPAMLSAFREIVRDPAVRREMEERHQEARVANEEAALAVRRRELEAAALATRQQRAELSLNLDVLEQLRSVDAAGAEDVRLRKGRLARDLEALIARETRAAEDAEDALQRARV